MNADPAAVSHDARTLLDLHQQLLQGDRVAPALLFQHLLGPLTQKMKGDFPFTDSHLISDGITDALLDFCVRPKQFDPARGVPVDRFLSQASWRNIRDFLRSEKRRKAREEKSANDSADNLVALPSSVANTEETEAALRQQSRDLMNILPDPIDRKIFELKLAGVRATGEFAKVMGIEHLSTAEQRQQVKRAKNRIDVHLKRQVRE